MKNVYEECPKFENEHWLLRLDVGSDYEKADVLKEIMSLLVAKDGVAFNGYWIYRK